MLMVDAGRKEEGEASGERAWEAEASRRARMEEMAMVRGSSHSDTGKGARGTGSTP